MSEATVRLALIQLVEDGWCHVSGVEEAVAVLRALGQSTNWRLQQVAPGVYEFEAVS